jgi:hypothetical protein
MTEQLRHGLVAKAASVRLDGEVEELWPKLGDGGLRKAAYRGG